jgi:hypothetical protein
MNNDSEAIRNLLAWLLQNPKLSISNPSGNSSSHETDLEPSSSNIPSMHQLDPIGSEEVDAVSAHISDLGLFSFEAIHALNPGDIPAVQERFHALLKRRLQTEIELNPPLFPWESEVCEYEPEVAAGATSGTTLWAAQLQRLQLLIPMPEAVLVNLLNQCKELANSSLLQGAKLVRAVEELFPGQSQRLNQFTELVLSSATRGTVELDLRKEYDLTGLPSHYDVANQQQQMVLSLLAAREILQSLTLEVSPERPVEREWQTTEGMLTLRAELPQVGHLRIQGMLPCAGSLQLNAGETVATSQRSDSGCVSVELFDLELNQPYSLEVRLMQEEHSPLVFAVSLTTQQH